MNIYKIGKVTNVTKNYIFFESNYNGFLINIIPNYEFEKDKSIKLYLYDLKTEYTNTTYGFFEFKERLIFADLLNINGIGPKSAISLLQNGWENAMQLIIDGNWSEISKFQFISQKSAKQIVFELQDKYINIESKNGEKINLNIDNKYSKKKEVIQTLKNLGFKIQDIDNIVDQLDYQDNMENLIENSIQLIANEKQSSI